MKIKVVQFIPAAIWFIIANILFLMPGQDLPSSSFLEAIYFDKWVHIGLFSGLTFLTAFPFIKSYHCSKILLIKISIAFIIYGVLIEFVQKYVALDRSFDVTDMLADATGCLIGYIVSTRIIHRIKTKNKPL